MQKSNLKSKRLSVKIIILAATMIILAVIFSVYLVYPIKYSEEIKTYSAIYGVRRTLVFAVIKTESGYDEDCVSEKGAIGLMQLMPDTAEYIASLSGEETADIYDPETNIRYGTKYLAYLIEKFGDERTAVAAYNAGEGNVTEWLTDERYSSNGRTLTAIPFAETEKYVNKVFFSEKIYRLLYNI